MLNLPNSELGTVSVKKQVEKKKGLIIDQTSLSFVLCYNFASQESLDLVTPQSQDASLLLSPPCSSTLISSPAAEHPQTESEKMDAHLLKKMAFR